MRDVDLEHWNDWRWQLRNRITTLEGLREYVQVSPEEAVEVEAASNSFRWAITPYYASLMDREDRDCPIRKQAIPCGLELRESFGTLDPLLEEENSPVESLIRVYPDRLAFCVTNQCPTFCRHCLRKRLAGEVDRHLSRTQVQRGIEYIAAHEEIRDVLLTGGDALLFPEDRLEDLIAQLRQIPHVELIRLGTRTPCTLPQRITSKLCDMLEEYHPIWINTQFNHPKEITHEAEEACARLLKAGIPLGNQSVLLRGINDTPEVMKRLVQELVRIRVRPYYLYQAQTLKGTEHFIVPIETGIEIIRSIRGFTTGFAEPKYVLDTPYGKIPMGPQYMVRRDGDFWELRSFRGRIWREFNPLSLGSERIVALAEAVSVEKEDH
jgi:lysine 2,3-aminomutase